MSRLIFDNQDFLNQLEELDKEQDAIQPYQTPPSLISVTEPTGPVNYRPDPNKPPRKKSLTELERDPEFAKRAERFLDGIGRNENIFEYLRDSDFSLTSAMQRSFEVGNWSEQEKEDYVYLRNQFDNAELRGVRERLGLAKDFVVDMVADPLNILATLYAVPTGGGTLAAKQAATLAAQKGIQKYITASLSKEGLKGAAVVGGEAAVWGGSHDYFNQSTELGVNIRNEIDWDQVKNTAIVGGVLGGTIGNVLGARAYFHKLSKYSDENDIIKANEVIDDVDEFVNTSKADKNLQVPKDKTDPMPLISPKWLSQVLFEKPTTRLAETAKTLEESPAMRRALEVFRYDSFDTFAQKKITEVRKAIYGEDLQIRNAKYQYELDRAIENLDEWGFFGHMSLDDSMLIQALIRDPKAKQYTYRIENDIKTVQRSEIDDKLIKAADDIKTNVLNPIWKEGNEAGIFGPFQQIINYFPRRFNYSAVENGRDILEQKIIKYGHADPINTEQALKNEKLFKQRQKEFYIKDGEEVSKVKGIDVTEIVDDKTAFGITEDFVEQARKELTKEFGDKATETQIITRAKELKAAKIVDGMLDTKYNPFDNFSYSDNYSFMQPRVFTNIPDHELVDFLETDLNAILRDYITSTSQVITRENFGMRTMSDFRKNYLKDIDNELQRAGGDFAKRQNREKVLKAFEELYSGNTGVGEFARSQTSAITKDGRLRAASEGWRLSQQLAHLGGVTMSSITEPLILLQRTPEGRETLNTVFKNAFRFIERDINPFRENSGIRRVIQRTEFKLPDGTVIKKAKPTTKAEKKLFEEEVWREAYQTGLALEQGIIERLEAMTGEAFGNPTVRKISHGFFKATLLEQWTKGVQLASFTTGKRLIRQNAEKLHNVKRGIGKKINDIEQNFLRKQLEELGIDADEAVDWYTKSLRPDGTFSELAARRQDFYAEKYLRGANRFTNEVILQPTAAMSNKPLWFNSTSGQILMQFAGYPTVFANTVLKRFSNDLFGEEGAVGLFKGPENRKKVLGQMKITGPRTVAATVALTGVAYFMNHLRTKGAYEDEPTSEKLLDAWRRWGGAGGADVVFRARDAMKYGNGTVHSIGLSPFGPAAQDIADMIAQRKGLASVAVSNIPGYALLDVVGDVGTKKAVKQVGREADKWLQEQLDKILQIERTDAAPVRFAEGGLVEGVVDISEDEQMDRLGLSIGGPLVSKLSKAFLKKGIPDKRPSAYHGSPTKFDEFDDLKKGGAMEDGVGYYFTDVEDYAKTFAGDKPGLKNVYKTKLNVLDEELINPHKGLKVKAMLDRGYGPDNLMSKKETDKIIKAVKNVQKDLREKGFDDEANKLQEYLDSGNLYQVIQGYEKLFTRDDFYNPISYIEKTPINLKYPLIQDALKEQGFKGLKIKQNYRVNPLSEDGIFKPQTTYVLFDKKDIQDLNRKEFGKIGSRASSDRDPAYMGLTEDDIIEETSFDEYYNNLGEQIPNAFVMRMSTKDYLKLTTGNKKDIDRIKKEVAEGYESGRKFGKFNPDKVDDRSYPIYLYINKYGKVTRHEGRHRAALIEAEGGNTVPVVIHLKEKPKAGVLDTPMSKIKKPKDLGIPSLKNQYDNDFNVSLSNEDVALVRRLNFNEDIDNAVSVANQPDRLKFAKGGTPITLYYIGETSAERLGATEGGLVKGVVDVPNVKDNPADTINKTTGLTYSGKTPVQQQMDDLLEEIV